MLSGLAPYVIMSLVFGGTRRAGGALSISFVYDFLVLRSEMVVAQGIFPISPLIKLAITISE